MLDEQPGLHGLGPPSDELGRLRAEVEQLQNALVAARTIGAAMGIVMATLKVTQDDAFELLRGASQNHNVKLRDLADEVVTTGVVPPPPRDQETSDPFT